MKIGRFFFCLSLDYIENKVPVTNLIFVTDPALAITVGNFAFLFNYTPVGRTSGSMRVMT